MHNRRDNIFNNMAQHFLQAMREHFIEAIVIFLIYFYGPFKKIQEYREWEEAELFIRDITIFLFFFSFLIEICINKLRIPSTLYTTFIKISSFLERILLSVKGIMKRHSHHIHYTLIVCTIFSGFLTINSAIRLQNKFIELKSPFFWDFIEDCAIYVLIILSILIILHYISELIDSVI